MYKPIFSLKDSEYKDKITRSLSRRSSSEIFVSSLLYFNAITLVIVVLAGGGLSIDGVESALFFSCLFITLSIMSEIFIKKYTIFSDVFETGAVLTVFFVNESFVDRAPPVFVICGVFFVAFLTLPVSIRSFYSFLFGKAIIVFSCFLYAYLYIGAYSEKISLTFLLVFLSVLVFVVAYWIYVRQIALLHQNFELDKLKNVISEKNNVLEKTKNDLNREYEIREKMIRHIGHDLRQPINTISFSLFNIDNTCLSKIQDAQVKVGMKSVDTANYLIENILQVASYGKVNIDVTPELFLIQDLLDLLHREFRSIMDQGGISFSVMPCSVLVESDFRLICRIMRNLISNAIKHAQPSKIVLGARRRMDQVEVHVVDNGIGISSSERDKVFDEFFSSDRKNGNNGLGLGLSISKNLACVCGARVWINSNEGLGTTSVLAMPIPSSDANKYRLDQPI